MAIPSIWLPNNNCFPARNGLNPRWLILHGTAGGTSAQAIAAYFKSTEGSINPVSAHYVIGTDGTIVQCNREADGAWSNGFLSDGHDPWWSAEVNPNLVTISIEHCKPHDDNSDALTTPQQASSFALIADICARQGIPARKADASGGITGHFSIDPQNRSRCPGTYPWDALWAFLRGEHTMQEVPQGWADDGQTLTCPNGKRASQGMRARIISDDTWNPRNLIEQEEMHMDQLEVSNPAFGSGQQMVCTFSMHAYKPETGVVDEYIGREVLALRAQNAMLQRQIQLLQGQLAAAQSTTTINDLKVRLNQIHNISTLS